MNSHKSYQFRIYLSDKGHARLDRILAECCDLYNDNRQHRIDCYNDYRIYITRNQQLNRFTRIRADDEFWGNISYLVGRGVIYRVNKTFETFYQRRKRGEKAGFPRFKSYNQYKCIELSEVRHEMVSISDNKKKGYIRIKGLPRIEFRLRRTVPSTRDLVSLRLVKCPTGWYVNLDYEFDPEPVLHPEDTVGIDMGINNRLALSSNILIEGRRPSREREKKLQRQLERRTKRGPDGKISEFQSRRRGKIEKSLARERFRGRVSNLNECHRITTWVAHTYYRIGVEKLRIKNLTRGYGKTIGGRRKGIAAKRSLNRRIRDQTWGTLRQQIQYKAEWAGGEFVEVEPQYTSRECSQCGHRSPQEEYRSYICTHCGGVYDRDLNAARNVEIRAFGDSSGVGVPPLLSGAVTMTF